MPSPRRPRHAKPARPPERLQRGPAKPRRPAPDRTPGPLPPLTLLFATGNAHKLAELETLVGRAQCTVVGGASWRGTDGAGLPEVDEDGDTFVANAAKKALAAHRASGLDAIADDSGLCVDALGGAPGVRSARYAGDDADDARNVDALLAALADVGDDDRGAHFVCALVIAGPIAEGPGALRSDDGVAYRAVVGRCTGRILREREGVGGFGYDPIFHSDALGKSFGAASAAEKHACSHRGAATAALLPLLTALRDLHARERAPLFVRPAGIGALTAALADLFDNDLRYAVRALERALHERPMLGGKERAAVAALLFSAIRRLGGLQLAAMALHGRPASRPDPRSLAPHDAAMIAALTLADVDEFGAPLPHRGPGEGSALAAMVARHANLAEQLPAPPAKLEKALRAARHATAKLADADALDAGVHPDFYAALGDALGPEHRDRALDYLGHQGPPTLRLRARARRGEVVAAVERLGVRTVAVPDLPDALVLLGTARVTALPAFIDGELEIQDAGSQRIARMVGARPGMKVADWCAGAGGKTLAIAAELRRLAEAEGGRPGRVVALDVHPGRLDEARRRVQRAGCGDLCEVRLHAADAAGDEALGLFDVVLVDVPCSSSGALRRTPELRWHLDNAWLERLPAQQFDIAVRAAARVRPGGKLVYATCSVLPAENEDIVARLADALGWPVVEQHREGPAAPDFLALGPLPSIGCDGFFRAALVRPHG